MPDSGECSDAEMNQPSCSRKAVQSNDREKRNRRIIMRVEFKDSDDTDADDSCSVSSIDNDAPASPSATVGSDLGARLPCSMVSQQCKSMRSNQKRQHTITDTNIKAATRISGRQHRRRSDANCLLGSDPDSSSEIDERFTRKRVRGKNRKKLIISDEEDEKGSTRTAAQADLGGGFSSDSSSSNELLEKCPICLLTFRQQELGRPATCDHIFCVACIEAWANNVQTCPIDRLAFDKIIVLDNCERRNIVREVRVDLSKSKKELVLDDEEYVGEIASEDGDVTNCEICNSPDREEIMLLCDSCNQGYHMDCLDPPLYEIPAGSWYCDNCIDSDDEAEDEDLELAEDLHTLFEDIRGMGLPETRLRVRQVQQPRILRTRQNERIRAAVLRHTQTSSLRQSIAGAQLETTTRTHTTTRGNRISTTTRTTRTTTRRNATSQRRRSRQTQSRTYVVEYDLNNFDEKFALKTKKKIIRRRRRRKVTRKSRSRKSDRNVVGSARISASKRLAEQLGVKIDGARGSHISGGSASSFTLFGNPNDLEYFSENDDVRDDFGGQIENDSSASTAVQTSVRIPSIGAQRNHKALLLGKTRVSASAHSSAAAAATDILSSIMQLQDRWHNASRNLSEVHINTDGSLNLPQQAMTMALNKPTKVSDLKNPTEHITQVPLYQRGGAGPNFGRGGSGNYNNRYSGNNSSRGVGGSGSAAAANQYQQHSAESMANSSDNTSTESSFGNQTFNINNSTNNSTPNTNFTPFNIRFNPPSQQQRNQNIQQSRQASYSSGIRMPLTPTVSPSTSFAHIIPQQQQRQLFSGLPAPINAPVLGSPMSMPPVLSVPPPPAPPPSLSWNSSLFKLNTNYGKENHTKKVDEDDDENCPNFSIYSQESQAVATELLAHPQTVARNSDQDDDEMNEDLVQLDDDDDIPLPPEPQTDTVTSVNESRNDGSDLYEPENPTDEQEDGNEIITMPAQSGDSIVQESNDEGSGLNCEIGSLATSLGKERDDDDDETKTRSTPSPIVKDSRTADRGKGVLELYDDSDWEELEIDRPKEFEKALIEEPVEDAAIVCNNERMECEALAKNSSSESDQDRSYTPCLDEKNMEEDAATGNQNNKSQNSGEGKNSDSKRSELLEDDVERVEGMSTELISEDEDLTNENEFKRRSRSRSRYRNEGDAKIGRSKRTAKRGKENSETFKKVGKRRKDRNYRGDKQQKQDRSHSHRSHSKTSRSATRSHSSRSPDHSRSRSPTRSPRVRRRNSRSKSYSRSRSHSPSANGRQRASFRGREYARGFGRGRGQRFNFRNQQFQHRPYHQHQHNQHQYQQQYHQHHHQYHSQNQYNVQTHFQRPKRRELPRYDVRNVVTASRHHQKDRYGRDAARSARSRSISFERRQRSRSYSRSSTRTRSHSGSPKRFRSFSISPSLPPGVARQQQGIRRRSMSPAGRRFAHSPTHSQPQPAAHRNSPMQRSNSTMSLRSRSNTPTRMNGSRILQVPKHSPGYSPRYTPRLSRSISKSPKKKKKKKNEKKKKGKKRPASSSPVSRQRRISRQRDPFDDADDFLAPQLGKKSKKSSSGIGAMHWSPSPTPSLSAERLNFIHDSGAGASGEKPPSWTPPLTSPQAPGAHYTENPHRSITPILGKKVKTKRDKSKKKKKPIDKQRKEKKRKRHTMTPEPLPSKEVFASGNNILVSVSFNKEANTNAPAALTQQQTVVTLPSTRDEFLGGRRTSTDRLTNSSGIASKKAKRKRKKLDAKPVAIIDLERSPFQVHQEPADVIVLTDSEDANDNQLLLRRERRRTSVAAATDHILLRENGQREKTPPTNCLETILEASYENLTQTTGPKTPPEPHLVKFNLPAKKQHKVRNNPLHDDADDIHSADELETVCSMRGTIDEPQQPHAKDSLLSAQKIGPNTPPESGPCSPDAYDPFEPTKSPSLSPRSPTPNPAQGLDTITLQTTTGIGGSVCGVEKIDALSCSQKHNSHSDDMVDVNISTPTLSTASNATTQANTSVSMNPVELVMALMSKPSSNIQQDIVNKSCDASATSYLNTTTMNTALAVPGPEDKLADNANTITVLSNVLLASSTVVSASQHIPVISSPPTIMVRKLSTLPKTTGSVASSSSGIVNLPSGSGTMRNGNSGVGGMINMMDDSFNMDIESPYSPGSADYEDLFEPPPDNGNAIGSIRRSKASVMPAAGKTEIFDNLFGSSSPVGQLRISSRYNSSGGRKQQRPSNKNERKSKIKGNKLAEDHGKLYDDVPNSAVDLQVKDRFIRKLNRQERVVEEVKLVLKPHFNKKVISKDDYKDIMRRAVPKICHSRSGEINPHKIKNLIDAYVRKFRAKHKKLSLLNTGQVSSAVKCAAYLKKL